MPVRKWPGEDQRIDAGVWYSSVVGEMRLYVDTAVGEGESVFVRRIGRLVGAVR